LIFVVFASACREDFTIGSTSEVTQNLSIVSEIDPSSPVVAQLAKTISLIGQESDVDISQAEISFSGTDLPTVFTKVIYISQEERFVLRNNEFRVSPGETYEMKAWLPGTDIDTIFARTRVPEPVGLDNVEILEVNEIVVSDVLSHYETVVAISFEQPLIQPAYFQLIPYRQLSTFRTDQSGQILITDTSEREGLVISSIESGSNAATQLTHKPGLYIDYARLNNQELVVTLRTEQPLIKSEELVNKLNLDVHTLSEELYDYHFSLSQQLINSSSDFFRPSSNSTNVENGLGVLGSFTTKSIQLEL